MSRRGWVVAGVIVGVVFAFGVTLAAVAYVHRDKIMGLFPGRPSGPPVPPKAFALPPPEAPATFPLVGDEGAHSDGYPKKTPSIVGMRALLVHRRFAELTSYVEQAEREALLDYRKEYWALDAVRGFAMPDPTLEPLLDAWVSASPRSFAPYAARAEFRSALGWHARGGEFAHKTSAQKFAALDRWLDLSSADVAMALKLEPNALAPRFLVLDDSRHTGDVDLKLSGALARSPESFLARFFAMTAVKPRWGGSYARMQAIADAALPHAGKNPRLALLPGLIEIAKVDDLEDRKDFTGARAASERALRYGEHWLFYEARADARERDGDHTGALDDITRGLAMRPEHPGLLADRAYSLWTLKRFEESGDAFLEMLRVDPTNRLENVKTYASAFEYAGRKHVQDGRPREALRAFDKALLLDPANADAKRGRAEVLSRGDPGANQAEVTAAEERALREDSFDAYRALDDVLARRGRFGEVIGHWGRYLAKHPDDGNAFLERGGAYTHIRRAAEAERDADNACKLGVQRGCELRTQMQEIQKRWREAKK